MGEANAERARLQQELTAERALRDVAAAAARQGEESQTRVAELAAALQQANSRVLALEDAVGQLQGELQEAQADARAAGDELQRVRAEVRPH